MLMMSPSTSSHINAFPPNHHLANNNQRYALKLLSNNVILPTQPNELIRVLDHWKVLEHRLKTKKYEIYPPRTSLFDIINQQIKETALLKS